MPTFQSIDIPIQIESGKKYTTPQGTRAIKDGIKTVSQRQNTPVLRKPPWLKVTAQVGQAYQYVKQVVEDHQLSTVCSEAHCPNIAECWSEGTATFMLMGSVCTRACQFCAVDTGNPKTWLDPNEPQKVAHAAELMQLNYVILTSVNRDDLKDGGAKHYAKTVRAIKKLKKNIKVEALTPDFQGNLDSVTWLVNSGIDVFAQNVETVERLTHPVRDPRASYWQTMSVLAHAKKIRPDIITKTSLMLGLGETEPELIQTMNDLRTIGVDILTLGQYLQPTPNHLPVMAYIRPEQFKRYRAWGMARGFLEVVSGPLIRSSYRAGSYFKD